MFRAHVFGIACLAIFPVSCALKTKETKEQGPIDLKGLPAVISQTFADYMTPDTHRYTARSGNDLVLMHVPYNFGHTIERAAMFAQSVPREFVAGYLQTMGTWGQQGRQQSWSEVRKQLRSDGEVWGHFNPDLQVNSNISGCAMYFTPQKYWPKDLAQRYFGNKTIFGMLRDPYERLVAMFRGDMADYGSAGMGEYIKTCDVNMGLKTMLKEYIKSDNKFMSGCTFLPQADFFDGEFGITLPIDNRRMPASVNELFDAHGYGSWHIRQQDIFHVNKCAQKWAADLDSETRGLIRQVYARDFDLLCKHFGYCDFEENTCISGVPQMCPDRVRAEMAKKQEKPHRV